MAPAIWSFLNIGFSLANKGKTEAVPAECSPQVLTIYSETWGHECEETRGLFFFFKLGCVGSPQWPSCSSSLQLLLPLWSWLVHTPFCFPQTHRSVRRPQVKAGKSTEYLLFSAVVRLRNWMWEWSPTLLELPTFQREKTTSGWNVNTCIYFYFIVLFMMYVCGLVCHCVYGPLEPYC